MIWKPTSSQSPSSVVPSRSLILVGNTDSRALLSLRQNACPHVLYTVMMVTALVCLAFCGLSKGASIYPHDVVDELAEQAAANMKAYLAQNPQSGCTVEKTAKRMEW